MDLRTIRERLAESRYAPCEVTEPTKWGAVAAIIRQRDGAEPEILLIRRAERTGDPWSGQMAFPGGHAQPEDANLRATAHRETKEEVGIDLDRCGELIGRLDDLCVTARGKPTGMVIAPHVFILHGEPEFSLSGEVAEVLWATLGKMARGEIDAVTEYWMDGAHVELPAYNVEDRIVWGLTHAMLQNLFAKLAGR